MASAAAAAATSSNVVDDVNEEFYDALETTPVSQVKEEDDSDDDEEENEEFRKIMERRFDFDSDSAKVPLHERLNEQLKLNKESKTEEKVLKTEEAVETDFFETNKEEKEQEAEAEAAGAVVQEEDATIHDSNYINEELLKKEEDELSADQLAERHTQTLELKEAGNGYFKEANYNSAIETYTNALKICPLIENKDRAILYSNRSVCFLKLLEHEKSIADCTKSISLDAKYTKPLIRRAECYENTDKLDEALQDYKKLVELEPKVYSHKSKCYQLEQAINERNEKLKTEMMGKLKDLGNLILKPFGLSTNNFQVAQDPNSGSYSINFKQ